MSKTNSLLNGVLGFLADAERVRKVRHIEQDSALFALSNQADGVAIDVPGLALPLLPYQTAAVAYGLQVRRTFIADQMGLGKTPTAIALCLAARTRGNLIVCPPSLTLNWAHEINRFAPGATVEILKGTKPNAIRGADFVIIGDAVLAAWAPYLVRCGFNALVIDESHRMKERTAKRTKAALAIASTIPETGIVALLSGTPIINRPRELVSQLDILGQLEAVFGSALGFLQRFTIAETVRANGGRMITKYDRANPRTIGELNTMLRGTCMVRRTRDQVLTLPGKGRLVVELSLNGALAEYRRAEADLIKFLKDTQGSAAATAAQQAEIITRMTILKRMVGEAKTAAVIDYVENLVEQGEPVIVFGWHRSVLLAIAKHFGAPTIMGGDTAERKQEAVEAFQSGKVNVIVGNISSMGVGFTLTRSANVVMAEMGWTPGEMDQAEDRADRIGQTRKVTVSYLTVPGTIDSTLQGILSRKRTVTRTVIDGDVFIPSEVEERSTILEVADELGRR